MSTRDELKEEYRAYREVAIIGIGEGNIRVSLLAPVLVAEGGAFVEASIWVPREVMLKFKEQK